MTQNQALQILKTGANVFLTGEPGSGKTHTINQYIAYLREHSIEPAITASTGIAATHIGGITIHSWSGIGIKNNLDKRELDKIITNQHIAHRVLRAQVLIIEEISMLSSETLDTVEAVCREIKQNTKPFGGLQIILVGDFFQLPPVVKNEIKEEAQTSLLEKKPIGFAYNSSAWARSKLTVCYLTEQYRQDDKDFLSLLSAIRRNSFASEYLHHLQARKIERHLAPAGIPKLFSHNINVDQVNDQMLNKLKTEPRNFEMIKEGRKHLVQALQKGCLSPERLCLKIGAAVMFTKNNFKEGFVNGTLGVVEEIDGFDNFPVVKTRSGKRIKVSPMDWTVEENGRLLARISQLPLRLAWAITVHKSQGMSLEAATMDLSDVFEFGQGYVALSRVRRLSGLYLFGWNERAFQVHPKILVQDKIFQLASAEAEEVFSKLSPIELQKKNHDFIVASGGMIEPIRTENFYPIRRKKIKIDTYLETFTLWEKGKTAKEISELRDLKEQTILSHLERLAAKGKIERADFARLISPTLSAALAEIHNAFRELETRSLSPVFEKFGGKYSYDDLHLARMILE
jgi:hypothetical protein